MATAAALAKSTTQLIPFFGAIAARVTECGGMVASVRYCPPLFVVVVIACVGTSHDVDVVTVLAAAAAASATLSVFAARRRRRLRFVLAKAVQPFELIVRAELDAGKASPQ